MCSFFTIEIGVTFNSLPWYSVFIRVWEIIPFVVPYKSYVGLSLWKDV